MRGYGVGEVSTDRPGYCHRLALADDQVPHIGGHSEQGVGQDDVGQCDAARIGHHKLVRHRRAVRTLHKLHPIHGFRHRYRRELCVKEVVAGIGRQRADHHGNAIVIGSDNVTRADVTEEIRLHDHVVSGAQVQEFISTARQRGGQVHQHTIRWIAVPVGVGKELHRDAGQPGIPAGQRSGLVGIVIHRARDAGGQRRNAGAAVDRRNRIVEDIHRIVRRRKVHRRIASTDGTQHDRDRRRSADGQASRTRDVVPKQTPEAAGIRRRNRRHKLKTGATEGVFHRQIRDGGRTRIGDDNAERDIAALVDRAGGGHQRLRDLMLRPRNQDRGPARGHRATARIGNGHIGRLVGYRQRSKVNQNIRAAARRQRSDIRPRQQPGTETVRRRRGGNIGKTGRRIRIGERNAAQRRAADVHRPNPELNRLTHQGLAIRGRQQRLGQRETRGGNQRNRGRRRTRIAGVIRVHVVEGQHRAGRRAEHAVGSGKSGQIRGRDARGEDAAVGGGFGEDDRLHIAAAAGNNRRKRVKAQRIRILVEITHPDTYRRVGQIGVGHRPVIAEGERHRAGRAQIQVAQIDRRGRGVSDAFRALVGRHGNGVVPLGHAGRPHIFIRLGAGVARHQAAVEKRGRNIADRARGVNG